MPRPLALFARITLALRLLGAAFLLLGAGWAHAVPSACTALWGLDGTTLRYFNSANSTWITAANTGVTGNALSAFEGDGTLYFASQVGAPRTMYRATFNNATGAIDIAQVSATPISVPAAITYTTTAGAQATITAPSMVGATFDRDTGSRRMFLYITTGAGAGAVPNLPVAGGGTSSLAALGVLDPEDPANVSWTTIYQTTGTGTVTYPRVGGSGDIFADQQTGALWIATNTPNNYMLELGLTYSGFTISRAQVLGSASIQVSAANLQRQLASVAVDPTSGLVYISDAATPATWRLADHTTNPVVGTLVTSAGAIGDSGNCVAPPDPPTVTKSFNPTTATTPGTSLLTITITNPNKVPIYTTAAMTDTFPSGMVVHTTPGITGTCYSDGTALGTRPTSSTLTGVAGATSAVVASGALIPGGTTSGGSCSFSIRVSATVANLYSNDIPAGALTTTAGSNTVAASANFQVQNISLPNAPTISKSFNPVTSTGTTGTATLTIVISNPNTVSNTVTSIFTDILPTNMRIANAPTLSAACFSNGVAVTRPAATTISAVTGRTTLTIALNSVIPGGALPAGGSCSFSVRVSQTVAGISANTIPVGSLTTVSGSNVTEATATYYLRASDFSVVKSQREGATGATTTANIEVASNVTISYVISIRNTGGVAGTRTFTDTLPALITPTLSMVTATVGGATACRLVTSTVSGATRIVGTVTGAPDDGGCDITIVAKTSITSVVSTATNVVFLGTVTGALDTDASNNTSTVVLVIKPAANLTISKDDGKTVLLTGSTNAYTITVANGGPADADGAVLKDPAATGLNCTDITCTESGGASCPLPAQLFVSALQSGTGLAIPTFPPGGTVTFVLTCTVTATGEP